MTDLPRFSEGAIGRLDYAHLNEMMRRLDVLLPVVQRVAEGGGTSINIRPLIFPAYAEPSSDGGEGAYNWWEATITAGEATWNVPTDDPNARKGGDGDAGEGLNTYGMLLDPSTTWEGGWAICFVLKRTLGGVAYVLIPVSAAGGAYVLELNGGGNEVTINTGDGSRSCARYSCEVYVGKDKTSLRKVDTNALAYDLNTAYPNEPTITPAEGGTAPALRPRLYDPGTMFLGVRLSARVPGGDPGAYAFGELPRFDVFCDPEDAPEP